jgi:hypothetical protein
VKKVVIFVGPSIPLGEARAVLPEATYLPPARQVDVLSAVGIHRPDVIGLIDGEFGQSLSVWHKEILYALDRGILVYGASSMGALRAAETAEMGMRGVGRIYEMFASGELNDDDEVALSHAPADSGYRSLSEPMVNLRATFHRLRDDGVVDSESAERLVAIAKSLFFPDRTFARILQEAAAQGVATETVAAVRAAVKHSYVDLKRQDALELLHTIRDLPDDASRPEPPCTLNRSHLFETLYNRDRRVKRGDFEVPLAAIANWAALHQPDFNELNFHALNRALLTGLADLLEVRVDDEEIEQELRRFRMERKLGTEPALQDWLRRNDLEAPELQKLVAQIALCRKLQRWLINTRFGERTTRLVLDELRLRGQYEAAAEKAAEQERILEERHQDFKETSFNDLRTRDLVVEHLRATPCRIPVHFRQWSEEAGFHTVMDLRVELLRARLARKHSASVADMLADVLDATP